MQYSRLFSATLALVLMVPSVVLAHIPEGMGLVDEEFNFAEFPTDRNREPLADMDTQRMALEMDKANCADLEALEENVQYAVLLTSMFLQRPGALSRIVGPDCQFLGDIEEVAIIEDESLTISGKREVLYYIPKMDMLIVSNVENNSVAYGITHHEEDVSPLEAFMDHRQEAESAAAVARTFSTMVASKPPPIFEPPPEQPKEQRQEVVEAPEASRSAKSRRSATGAVGQLPVNTGDTPPEEQPIEEDILSVPPTTEPQELPEPQEQEEQPPVYVDVPSEQLPRVEPLGPEPEPESTGTSGGLLIMIFFGIFVLIVTAVVVLKTRVNKKDAYLN